MSVAFLNPDEIAAVKRIAAYYKMSVADYVRELLRNSVEREIAEREKRKMIHERLANLEEASEEESAEILAYLENMSEEDHEIVAESVIYV